MVEAAQPALVVVAVAYLVVVAAVVAPRFYNHCPIGFWIIFTTLVAKPLMKAQPINIYQNNNHT